MPALIRARLGFNSALEDVERLLTAPTPHRLYNAACARSILSETTGEPRHARAAVRLLRRALVAGFPPVRLDTDPDLDAARALPEFERLREQPRPFQLD